MPGTVRLAVGTVVLLEGEEVGLAEGLDADRVATIFRDEASRLAPLRSRLDAGEEVIVDVPVERILSRSWPGRLFEPADERSPRLAADQGMSPEGSADDGRAGIPMKGSADGGSGSAPSRSLRRPGGLRFALRALIRRTDGSLRWSS